MLKFIKRHIVSKDDLVNLKDRIANAFRAFWHYITTTPISEMIYKIISSTIFQIAIIVLAFYTGVKCYNSYKKSNKDISHSKNIIQKDGKEFTYDYSISPKGTVILLKTEDLNPEGSKYVSKHIVNSKIKELEAKILSEKLAQKKLERDYRSAVEIAFDEYSEGRRQDIIFKDLKYVLGEKPVAKAKPTKKEEYNKDILINKYNASDLEESGEVKGDLYLENLSSYRTPEHSIIHGDLHLKGVKRLILSYGTVIKGNIITDEASSIAPINHEYVYFKGQIFM